MAGSTQNKLFFSVLNDLAMFYPFSSYANNLTLVKRIFLLSTDFRVTNFHLKWTLNGGSLYNKMIATRDPTISSNQICQVGLDNTANYTLLINSFGSVYVSQYLKSLNLRRRRQITTYTCTMLNNLGAGIKSLSPSALSTISLSDFYSCQSLLGATSNSWSSSQLAVLAATAKSVITHIVSLNEYSNFNYLNNLKYYGSALNISDINISLLNSIMVGFSSTDLSSLVFTTKASLSTLGALTGWTYSVQFFSGVYQVNN